MVGNLIHLIKTDLFCKSKLDVRQENIVHALLDKSGFRIVTLNAARDLFLCWKSLETGTFYVTHREADRILLHTLHFFCFYYVPYILGGKCRTSTKEHSVRTNWRRGFQKKFHFLDNELCDKLCFEKKNAQLFTRSLHYVQEVIVVEKDWFITAYDPFQSLCFIPRSHHHIRSIQLLVILQDRKGSILPQK